MTNEDLLKIIIEFAPENSYWGVQGFYDPKSLHLLKDILELRGTCETDKVDANYFIKLNRENKSHIEKLLTEGELMHDIVHQYICKDGIMYFISYDYLDSNIIINNFIPDNQLSILIQNQLIDFNDGFNNQFEPTEPPVKKQ